VLDWAVDNAQPLPDRTYGGWMKDDPSLHDEQLETEIRLVGDLVLAASQSEDRLSQEAIDEILGLEPSVGVDEGSVAADATG
jgi:hypothetical protein